jgi:peptide deformylase
MVLEVVKYGHPVLRKKGAKVEQVTPAIRRLIADLKETMYAARGVGLAAQQVGEAVQVTVVDVREAVDRPSTLEAGGEKRDPNEFMPLVLINPEIAPAGEPVMGPEGCLSFPGMYADIMRPETVDVTALDEHGRQIKFRCGGLLARAIQHETDHLNGILFIDRMDSDTKFEMQAELDALSDATKAELKKMGAK